MWRKDLKWRGYEPFPQAPARSHPCSLEGEKWAIPALFGYAGWPLEAPIRINARTGAIDQLGNQPFQSYVGFKLYLLWAIPLRKVANYLEELYLDNWPSRENGHNAPDLPP